MQYTEKSLVKLIAKVSPWLAPLPSGYFVARASIAHLDLPAIVGISVGIIVEFLGISSVHTWLWLTDWNSTKRKSDRQAPTLLAASLGVIYLSATVGLTVVLEVMPALSTYAPVLFPALAIVGAVNLVLISQQEHRERVVNDERQERKAQRVSKTTVKPQTDVNIDNRLSSASSKVYIHDNANRARRQVKTNKMDTIVDILNEYPDISITELARRIGRSRTATYNYLEELEQSGQISRSRNGGRF